jgi:hypothetical protein
LGREERSDTLGDPSVSERQGDDGAVVLVT